MYLLTRLIGLGQSQDALELNLKRRILAAHRLTSGTEGFSGNLVRPYVPTMYCFLYICARAPLHHSQRLTPFYLGYIQRSTSCASITSKASSRSLSSLPLSLVSAEPFWIYLIVKTEGIHRSKKDQQIPASATIVAQGGPPHIFYHTAAAAHHVPSLKSQAL